MSKLYIKIYYYYFLCDIRTNRNFVILILKFHFFYISQNEYEKNYKINYKKNWIIYSKDQNYISTFIYQSFVLKYLIFVDNLYRILLSTINNE